MAETTITQLPNDAVITAIRAHHDELSSQLRERTAAVLAATRTGDAGPERERLHSWYQSELIPHATAEERTLYAAGAGLETTRLLVQGMVAEHHALVGLIAQLALASDQLDVVAAATSAQDVFTVHLAKENDLLLPALDDAGVPLVPLLEGMHELLGHRADLDVRTLPHGQRHEIIFAKLDALDVGESLTIVNDHDPKPLRYQSEAMWPERFTWTYRDTGPQVWRVAITRAR